MAGRKVLMSENLVGTQQIPRGWRTIHVFCIQEDDGKKYFYRVFDGTIANAIEEETIVNPTEISWEKLDDEVKKAHQKNIEPG